MNIHRSLYFQKHAVTPLTAREKTRADATPRMCER